MTQALPPALRARVDELKAIDDLTEKYEVLIEMGRELKDIPAEMKKPECMVHGCQSLVHIYSELDANGKLVFHGYADAMIVNGLLSLLVLGLSGLTPREFLAVPPDFIVEAGVLKSLTPSRVNGFYNMHEKMKVEALKHAARLDAAS
ncbi:MAG: SufE family protein [candidate division FCPU426 bacterium]